MKQILCFGDSNTWGLIPKTNKRYEWGVRWTSLLNESLNDKKEGGYRVIEEGLCGRTTVFDDPLRDGRNGVKILPTILETHDPVDIVIIMLGTNDCKTVYNASAEFIGQGVKRLIGQVKNYIPDSKILVISPIHLGEGVWESDYDPEFSSASVSLSKKLTDVYKKIAAQENVGFIAASEVASPSTADREHLSEEGHKGLAREVEEWVKILKLFVVFINTKNNLDIIRNIRNSMIKYVIKLFHSLFRSFNPFHTVKLFSTFIAKQHSCQGSY